jgi:hypothetical protein
MTDFAVPPVAVDYDARWVEVDLTGDLGDWARRTAGEILGRTRASGHDAGKTEPQVADLLEGAGALARQAGDAAIALLLYPSMADGVKAVVRFCLVDLDGRDDPGVWPELLGSLVPPEPGPDGPEVTELPSRAGPCRRIRQRYTTGAGSIQPVGEQLGYVWVFPQYGAGVVMSTGFADLLDAGRYRPAVDTLAAAVELDAARGEVARGEVASG